MWGEPWNIINKMWTKICAIFREFTKAKEQAKQILEDKVKPALYTLVQFLKQVCHDILLKQYNVKCFH
jgi:predicted ABC-class ATPase